MILQGTAMASVTSISVLLACISATVKAQPLWEKLQVEEDDIRFNVAFRDGGYTKPYRIKFIENGARSVYKFQADGCVTNIKVGEETYEPVYGSSADVIDVVRTERRNLAEVKEEVIEGFVGEAVIGNRRLFACDDCADIWETLCDKGVSCVCKLLDFESDLSAAALKSFETMCKTFGSGACSPSSRELCAGQCEDEETENTPAPVPAPFPTTPAPTGTGTVKEKNIQHVFASMRCRKSS